ncbi:MAG: hypothetical protein L3J46_01775 [Kangiellaceae bacterium]|nr:hypothetical protein [Kangiellaceae bacterium]
MELWIYFTILAALMQAVRTAGQKQLSHHLSAAATTLVRFLFALPLVWSYLFFVQHYSSSSIPEFTTNLIANSEFTKSASFAAIAQIAGTVFVIMAFRYQNFAVATSLVKTEAILTAIMGVVMFDAVLSGFGWLSVLIGVIGVLILSKADVRLKSVFESPASAYGVLAGLGFALATLWIRQASLSLEIELMLSAAITLAFMVSLQTILILTYILIKERPQINKVVAHWKISSFVGLTSMLGSVGRFTATSFQTAAYVKALGQIEFFFTLVITYRVFKEHIHLREYIGMLLIVLSVLVLMLLT